MKPEPLWTPPPKDDERTQHEIGNRVYLVADVSPLDVDGVRTVAIGTAVWLIGLLVLLPFRHRLAADGHTWWLWTCVAGVALGIAGWEICRRRRRARIQARTQSVLENA